MKGYLVHSEDATRNNQHDRRMLFTARHSQLVLMSLKPGEEIGEEVYESEAPRQHAWSSLFRPSRPIQMSDQKPLHLTEERDAVVLTAKMMIAVGQFDIA